MAKIERRRAPQIDIDGVHWCTGPRCEYWLAKECLACRKGRICIWWARLAAVDNRAMNAMRDGQFTSLQQVAFQGGKVWCVSDSQVRSITEFGADDPAEAVLKAVAAAEKGGA